VSRITGQIFPPEPLIVEGEKEGILREAKTGIESESYLESYQNGVMISRKLLRKDAYAPTRGIIIKKSTVCG
ncbi:MAG: G5 domain-containing protein, partial [Clostridia bacterium]|nr:G5 domain-containing protein [Clostridia bacterium]